MKKITALLLILATALLLVSCGKENEIEIPEGMQLVYGSDEAGYLFFAPEEWTVSNVGEIKSAYISQINTTSVSFARVHPEKSTPEGASTEDYFFDSYFDDSLTEFTKKPTELTRAGATIFGAKDHTADRAEKYTYTIEYSGHTFGFMQILIKKSDRYYIFTYSAQNSAKEGEESNYAKYSEKVTSVIDSFKFTNGEGVSSDAEYPTDNDGYKLVSNSDLSYFDLYVPADYSVDCSSAIVSATHTDGTNVNMTVATATGVVVSDYWENRKKELSEIVTELTEISADDPEDPEKTLINVPVSFADAKNAFAYEYTYTYNGVKYRVYQVLAVKGTKGYVFTFTSPDELYGQHTEELNMMLEKVGFR